MWGMDRVGEELSYRTADASYKLWRGLTIFQVYLIVLVENGRETAVLVQQGTLSSTVPRILLYSPRTLLYIKKGWLKYSVLHENPPRQYLGEEGVRDEQVYWECPGINQNKSDKILCFLIYFLYLVEIKCRQTENAEPFSRSDGMDLGHVHILF